MIVETRHGRVQGRAEDGIHVFRGIPFARAGRWEAPGPPEPWAGVRDASAAGPAAPQRGGFVARLVGGGGEPTDEDCLSLNVWTPGLADGSRPVWVWIHGGGFTTGSGGLGVYDGAALARRGDVVVVTLNYRLGALGFLALGEWADAASAGANFGLLDQVAALGWVREHAAAFGGDPARVTLVGQSAGAMCVGALLGAPAARGLFQRAILQSGAAHNVHPPEAGRRVRDAFVAEAGTADLARLRALPVDAILSAQERTLEALRRELAEPPFQPVVDDRLLPRQPIESVALGAAADVSLLVGTNLDEWRFYGLTDPKASQLDEAGLLRRYRRGLPGVDADGRELAQRVVEVYRRARPSDDATRLWFAIQTDRWFRYPATALAELQAAHRRETYAYLFTRGSPALGGDLGACHAIEVPYVFGTHALPSVAPLVGEGAGVTRLSERMQAAWLAFVRGEAPAAPGLPGWPAYDAGRRATLVLGDACRVAEAPGEPERAFWAGIDWRLPEALGHERAAGIIGR